MALSETMVADGVSASITGLQGNVDVSIKRTVGSVGTVFIEVSYDSGVTWNQMQGGYFGGSSNTDSVMVAGDSTVQYRFRAVGVTGSIMVFMGQD